MVQCVETNPSALDTKPFCQDFTYQQHLCPSIQPQYATNFTSQQRLCNSAQRHSRNTSTSPLQNYKFASGSLSRTILLSPPAPQLSKDPKRYQALKIPNQLPKLNPNPTNNTPTPEPRQSNPPHSTCGTAADVGARCNRATTVLAGTARVCTASPSTVSRASAASSRSLWSSSKP